MTIDSRLLTTDYESFAGGHDESRQAWFDYEANVARYLRIAKPPGAARVLLADKGNSVRWAVTPRWSENDDYLFYAEEDLGSAHFFRVSVANGDRVELARRVRESPALGRDTKKGLTRRVRPLKSLTGAAGLRPDDFQRLGRHALAPV